MQSVTDFGSRERHINNSPITGQWYTRLDTREEFVVTGYDDKSHTIETQAINGDLDEIDAENWRTLPLEFAEPPEDWSGAPEDVDIPGMYGSATPMERFLSS